MASGVLFTEWLHRRGGLAHGVDIRAAGYTINDVRSAIGRGYVRRIRRTWLVSPRADPAAVKAVDAGGGLTCLSEASRAGLWTPDHTDLHVSVRPTSSARKPSATTFHWSPGPMPVARHAWREPLINVLAHVATCVAREHALAVWESALRKRLVTRDELTQVAWKGPRARELAELASLLSDSGLETYVVERLRPFGLSLRQQVLLEGHRVDILIGRRLVVQVDGFEFHHDAKDRRRDISHDARLALRGYTVLRFDYAQILFGWPQVESTILTAVAQGRHVAR